MSMAGLAQPRSAPYAAGMAFDEGLAEPFDMGRRPSRGSVMVGPEGITTDDSLTAWVDRSLAFATSLPPKLAVTRQGQRR